ncbi:hypothetical protein K0M31_007858 [Melipona bicolor]|uniref:Uncharacterized protein n=1 Tax=Melipona bicolor TaxID=60889 RepID=A0AA40GC73_9HYME|nr:hypothetical protein K0M31_007858 [Melipona bicolor]
MDNLPTARYDATRENVSRGRAPGSFFDFIERFFFTRETRVRFVYACLTFARWLYKIDGERDEILIVDIYRCDEDDFQNKKVARDSGGWSDCEISYVLRHTRSLWRIWSNWN